MAERLGQVEERISSVGQLSSVVAAIRGIAAARLREGQERLSGVRAYAEAVGVAIGEALSMAAGDDGAQPGEAADGSLVIVLCSEQGFVGAYNSRLLDAAGELVGTHAAELFVIGDHGSMLAAERGLEVASSVPMATHVAETTDLANRLADALFDRVRAGVASAIIVHATADAKGDQPIVERPLIPFDFARFPQARLDTAPLITLPARDLLVQLAEEYVFAELCEALILAFAAENEARMRAMIAAHDNVAKRLDELKAIARRTRQEEITSEVVELAGGVQASSEKRRP